MAVAKTRVQSGDVISATLMNYVLEQLEQIQGGTPTELEDIKRRLQALEAWRPDVDTKTGKVNGIEIRLTSAEASLDKLSGARENITTLQLKVANLESLVQVAGKVRITGFDPPDVIPVGQVLTILGNGFKPTLTDNLVFINNTPIYNFQLDSDATHLKIVVPKVVIPTPDGTPITIRVSNNDGEAQRGYKVVPEIPAAGTPPKITAVYRDSPNHEPSLLGNGSAQAIAEGQGLGVSTVPVQLPTVTFIYQTSTGPVSYPVPQANISFVSFGFPNAAIRFLVPIILEAPLATPFPTILKIGFGNHVPALAQVMVIRQ